jgi:uncharacterized protein DUF664
VGVAGELRQLCEALAGQRAAVLKKLSGLSEDDARRSTVGSGTNLAGLVQHLTFAESKWFEAIVAGRPQTYRNRTMAVDPAVTLRSLRADYQAACRTSDQIIESFGSADAPVHDGARNLRSVLLGMIEETARHAGHADIIREQIDGRTGR